MLGNTTSGMNVCVTFKDHRSRSPTSNLVIGIELSATVRSYTELQSYSSTARPSATVTSLSQSLTHSLPATVTQSVTISHCQPLPATVTHCVRWCVLSLCLRYCSFVVRSFVRSFVRRCHHSFTVIDFGLCACHRPSFFLLGTLPQACPVPCMWRCMCPVWCVKMVTRCAALCFCQGLARRSRPAKFPWPRHGTQV